VTTGRLIGVCAKALAAMPHMNIVTIRSDFMIASSAVLRIALLGESKQIFLENLCIACYSGARPDHKKIGENLAGYLRRNYTYRVKQNLRSPNT
jgi:hypothetical protein